MVDEREGNLRIIKALAFSSFFLAIFFLILSYSFLQNNLVIPAWHLLSPHYPSKETYFYAVLIELALVFFFYSLGARRIKKFPTGGFGTKESVFGISVLSKDLKHWSQVWLNGLFFGVSLFLLGTILKIWQVNNPQMSTLSIGFSLTLLVALAIMLMAFVYPLLRIINPKSNGSES